MLEQTIILYKTVIMLMTGCFCYLIWPFRDRHGARRIVSTRWFLVLRISFAIIIPLYVWFVFAFQSLSVITCVGGLLQFAGLCFVWQAKRTLKANHTPAGMFLDECTLIQVGIYSIVRHPLYAGIICFMIGGLVEMSINVPYTILIPCVMAGITITVLLSHASSIEESELKKRLGQQFLTYRHRVPRFIPRIIQKKHDV